MKRPDYARREAMLSGSARSALILYGLLGYFPNDVTHGSIERIW